MPANLSSKSKLTNCSLSKVVLIKEANTGLNMKNLAQFFQVASHFLAIGLPKIYSGRVIRKRSEPLFLDFQKILKCFYGEHIYTVGYGTQQILRYNDTLHNCPISLAFSLMLNTYEKENGIRFRYELLQAKKQTYLFAFQVLIKNRHHLSYHNLFTRSPL